jgi:drug/metabolite transporter (DMT)-like permease
VFRDYLRLHFIVFLWGFTATLGKLITLPAVEMVFWRTLIASAGIGFIWVVFRRRESMPWRPSLALLASGAVIAGHWICFFAAAKVASASIALAGISLTPLLTSFLEPMINGGRVRRREVLLGIVAIFGLMLIFGFEFEQSVGLALGIGAATLGSLFTIIIARFTPHYPAVAISFYQVFGACLASLLFFPIYARLPLLNPTGAIQWLTSWSDIGWTMVLAIVCTVFPYVMVVELLRRLSAFSVNLAVNMESIYGIFLALLIFRVEEQMTIGFYIGIALILSSVIAQPLFDKWAHRRMKKKDTAARLQASA